MNLETWKITGTGFHFGQHGLGQEETSVTFPSDSLFAALVTRLAEWEPGTLAKFLEPFEQGSPPFVLSSTFPFAGEVRFFPTPLALPEKPGTTSPAVQGETGVPRPKDLKRIAYVSETLYRELLNGIPLRKLFKEALSLQRGKVLVHARDVRGLPAPLQAAGEQLWEEEKRPRVTLGRVVQTSAIFHTGRVTFAAGCGLWFAVKFLDPQAAGIFPALLTDLGIAGLGGTRSMGFGPCTIQKGTTLELPDPGDSRWTTLSRYLPCPDELPALADPGASYQVVPVVGWIDSASRRGLKRIPLNMLSEGSVFGPLGRPVPGQMVDVRPRFKGEADPDPQGHPVYRAGYALAVGLKEGVA